MSSKFRELIKVAESSIDGSSNPITIRHPITKEFVQLLLDGELDDGFIYKTFPSSRDKDYTIIKVCEDEEDEAIIYYNENIDLVSEILYIYKGMQFIWVDADQTVAYMDLEYIKKGFDLFSNKFFDLLEEEIKIVKLN